MGKKVKEVVPGWSLGYPMFHAMTGNLPPASPELFDLYCKPSSSSSNKVDDDADAAVIDPRVGESSGENTLQPGWIRLKDPFTRKYFWWNTHHRCRREVRPTPTDDGRILSGTEEKVTPEVVVRKAKLFSILHGKTWEQKYSLEHSCVYYLNRKMNLTQWERPVDFYEDGLIYRPRWVESVDNITGETVYFNRLTFEQSTEQPFDYDPIPVGLCWELTRDRGWFNWMTHKTSKEKPKDIDENEFLIPDAPPPDPPSIEDTLDLFVDDYSDDETSVAPTESGKGASSSSSVLSSSTNTSAPNIVIDEKIFYPPIQGSLEKRGGGYSFMGKKNWKERYFVSQDGILTYYESKEDFQRGGKPLKNIRINLRYYGIDALPSSETKFMLLPLADAHLAFRNNEGVGVPYPDRIFELNSTDASMKALWVAAFRGVERSALTDENHPQRSIVLGLQQLQAGKSVNSITISPPLLSTSSSPVSNPSASASSSGSSVGKPSTAPKSAIRITNTSAVNSELSTNNSVDHGSVTFSLSKKTVLERSNSAAFVMKPVLSTVTPISADSESPKVLSSSVSVTAVINTEKSAHPPPSIASPPADAKGAAALSPPPPPLSAVTVTSSAKSPPPPPPSSTLAAASPTASVPPPPTQAVKKEEKKRVAAESESDSDSD